MSSIAFGKVQNDDSVYDPETRLWLESAFPVICNNLDEILQDPKLFWSVPPHSRVGFSFGGSFPVPIGIWAIAWKKGIGVCSCEYCGGKAFSLSANGTMSMGSSQGLCSECGKAWNNRIWSVGIWGFLRNEILKKIDAFDLSEGVYPEAYDFDEVVGILR